MNESTLVSRTHDSSGSPMDQGRAAAAWPADLCLHRLFEEQARSTPGQLAVVFEGQSLTYGELDRRANQLASHLRALNAGPDALVGLFVERSLEMVVAILGILKAGAAYVPIDTEFPPARIAHILQDAEIGLLVTQSTLLARLPSNAGWMVCLDSFDWCGLEAPKEADPHAQPSNLAYVIYTSGSTGHPKGVCIEHRSIVNYVLGVTDRLGFEPGMKHATVSTIAADLGNTVIFPALATGGCLHVISQERAQDSTMLASYFSREAIDVLKIVPSHLAALQAGEDPEGVMPRRILILGGEASRAEWIGQLRRVSPGCKVYNHYGPTETTVGVLTYHVEGQLPATRSGTLPLGRPLPNTSIHILDAQGQTVPIGEEGELCIGGRGVARGYLNRSELTAEKFVPDPFSRDPGQRLYRSGDLARYLPDGNIEFCGRIDHQVKMHGYRIELGEIEASLRDHDGVRDALVLSHADESGNKRLVGYVVPERKDQPLWASKGVHVLPDGSVVAHLNRNETDYIYNEIFVLQAYLRHGITISAGDCIVDVGSNIGLFAVFASRLVTDLKIICAEPNPAAFACLEANTAAWGTAVKCLPIGLSSENKSAELTFFEGLSLLSGFYADPGVEREVVKSYVLNQQSGSPGDGGFADEVGELIDQRLRAKTISTQLLTLSRVIAEEDIDRIDLLKINAEKSELDVLLGLNAGDWSKVRQMVIEVDQQKNLAPIESLLRRNGFSILVEQDPLLRSTELCYVYAIRPSPSGATVITDEDGQAHRHPLAPPDPKVLTPKTLRSFLKERLPQYMIPSAFVLMNALPLTSNGKIDRKALPVPSRDDMRFSEEFARPSTDTQKTLAAIWAEVLNIEEIGVNEDFFDLGGQSLLAIKTVSRIRDAFEVNLPLRNLFESPTIATLSEAVDALVWLAQGEDAASTRINGDREEIEL